MEGDSKAVKSSGGTAVVSATDESTMLIKNADAMAEIQSQLNYSLVFLPQCVMLVCVLRLRYQGKEETPVTDYPILMSSFLCSFLVSVLLMVVLSVDACMSFTNKLGPLCTILKHTFRLSSYVALLSLITIVIEDFISK